MEGSKKMKYKWVFLKAFNTYRNKLKTKNIFEILVQVIQKRLMFKIKGISNAGVDIGKGECLYTIGSRAISHIHCRNLSGGFPTISK